MSSTAEIPSRPKPEFKPKIQVEGEDLPAQEEHNEPLDSHHSTTYNIPCHNVPIENLDNWKRGKDFKNLRELLKKIRIQHADTRKHFWTDILLRQAITRDRVIEELESHEFHVYHPKEDTHSLLDHILPKNDPNKDHGSHNAIERDKSWIMDRNSFFKIFVVLIWSVRGKDIGEFIKQGICDDYLPMFNLGNQEKTRSWSGDMTEAQRKCFSDWEELSQEAFERDQYEFMIPYFGPCRNEPSSIRDVKYISGTILPWIAKDTRKEMIGGYGRVSCVTPHHTSHGFQDLKQVKAARGVFARKTIIKGSNGIYDNEGKMLRLFSGRHDHLLTLLMTFTLDGCGHLLFPWAECDLEIFWKRSPAPYSEVTKTMDQSKIKWMSEQIVGITSALHEIHCPQHLALEIKKFARHGDIKPENIFWFPSNEKSQGMLVIGDFGIASIHGDKSKSNVPNQSVPHSPDYRPPECDQEGGVISRAFDIWTLGCLLMEMVCWALGGASMIDDFDKERSTVPYIGAKTNIWFDLKKWNEEEYVVMVKETVTKWMRKLSEHEGCTEYIHDLLSVINDHMLVVLSSSADRIISEKLLKKFKEMNTKVQDHAYISNPWKSKKIFPEPVAVKTKLNHMAKQRIANRKDLLVDYTGSQVQEAKTPKEMTNVDGAANDYLIPVP